jgi:GWxTD domain-containing protein
MTTAVSALLPATFYRLATGFLTGAILGAGLLAPAAADDTEDLAQKYKTFLNKDALYIMLPAEREKFLALTSDRDRDLFIDSFWQVRDPIPETLRNEFQDEHYKRMRTERGQMYITLGAPHDISRYPNTQRLFPLEVWQYQGLQIRGVPAAPRFMFFKRNGVGEYRLYSPVFDGMKGIVADKAIAAQVGFGNDIPPRWRQEFALEIMDAAVGIGPGYTGHASEEVLMLITQPGYTFENLRGSMASRVTAEVSFGRDLPVDFGSDYFRGQGDFAAVHIALEIKPENLHVKQYEDSYRGRIDLFGTVTTPDGQIVEEFRDTAELQVEEVDWEQAQKFPFLYQRKLSLLPGRYNLQLIVRDFVVRRVATLNRTLSVPRFPRDRMSVSSSLAGFKADSLQGVRKDAPFAHTFGQLIIFPKPNKVFGLNQRVLAFLQVYYPPDKVDAGRLEIDAHFILRSGNQLLLDETNRYRPDLAAADGTLDILKILAGPFPGPGDYTLEVELTEETTGFSDMVRLDFHVSPDSQPLGRLSTMAVEELRPAERFLVGAHKYLLAGDYQKAATRFQAALDYDPMLQGARLGKARAEIYSGDPVAGEKTAREALERDPKSFGAVTMLGF